MHIHLIGIGGIGMSGLARLYKARGFEVTGSDQNDSLILEELLKEGMGVFVGHASAQVAEDVDFVVYSEAIPVDNLERETARTRGIPEYSYFEALGCFADDFKLIAVAGTHGKTTTTALIARLLLQSYRDPTVMVGSRMMELEAKNARFGGGEWMVAEACEYRRSFLHLNPQILVLTNLELDHVDYYSDLDDYKSAFAALIAKLPQNGLLIANGNDGAVREVAAQAPCEVVYFYKDMEALSKLTLHVPGQHNRLNALAAFLVGRALDVEEEMMVEALNGFTGTWRRFEYKGDYHGAHVYDDYAHHPTEVEATLLAAREKYPDRRLVAVFQPHQHSRAKRFLKGFGEAFQVADQVFIPNIYASRDSVEDRESMTVEQFVQALKKYHANLQGGDGMDATVELLKDSLGDKDLVLVMGAGDVWRVSEALLS